MIVYFYTFKLLKCIIVILCLNFYIFSSRSIHSEQSTSTRDNSHLYLNPSGGAIPKQKNTKSNNNRRVINDRK